MTHSERNLGAPKNRTWIDFLLGRSNETDEPELANGESSERQLSQIETRAGQFEGKTVEDVMIARSEIRAVEAGQSLEALIKVFAEAKHSRLPVYRKNLDDPTGFIHIKDLVLELAKPNKSERNPIEKIVRPLIFVPPSMNAKKLLRQMQEERQHIALVVDEYGGTDGLVSLEDILEEIVGEIDDEHDDPRSKIKKISDNEWQAGAKTEIEEFKKETKIDLELPSDKPNEFDTLGGVAIGVIGHLPKIGEIIEHPKGVKLEVLDADERRIKTLKISADALRNQTANNTQ